MKDVGLVRLWDVTSGVLLLDYWLDPDGLRLEILRTTLRTILGDAIEGYVSHRPLAATPLSVDAAQRLTQVTLSCIRLRTDRIIMLASYAVVYNVASDT